jgi:hypothetical protein
MKFQSAIQSGGLNSNLQTLLQFPVYFFRFTASNPAAKKLIKRRKGVRKNDLKQWHPGEIRDWDIE